MTPEREALTACLGWCQSIFSDAGAFKDVFLGMDAGLLLAEDIERAEAVLGEFTPASRQERDKRVQRELANHDALLAENADLRARLEAEREACAKVADYLAEIVESGAGEDQPGHRLRQVARMIRDRA